MGWGTVVITNFRGFKVSHFFKGQLGSACRGNSRPNRSEPTNCFCLSIKRRRNSGRQSVALSQSTLKDRIISFSLTNKIEECVLRLGIIEWITTSSHLDSIQKSTVSGPRITLPPQCPKKKISFVNSIPIGNLSVNWI